MEGAVIRSQFGFSGRSAALVSSRTTHRSRQVTTVVLLQKAKTTSDYFGSLLSAELSVDSTLGSFFPVLPAPIGAPFAGTEVLPLLDAPNDGLLHFLYSRFVALVKRPLFDALGFDQSGLQEDLQVLAGRGLAHAELLCDQHAADAILHQIPIHLRPEVLPRLLQPFQDLQPAVVRQGAQGHLRFHIDS